MSRLQTSVPIVLMLVLFHFQLLNWARGQEKEKRSRVDYIQDQADKLTIEIVEKGLSRAKVEKYEKPLLRFTNPLYIEQSDGLFLIWTQHSVPIVAASYTIRNNKELFRELASLDDRPLVCSFESKPVWKPSVPGFLRADFQGTPEPHDNERLRLAQMKRLAERFSVADLRLMPTPLYRYTSKERNILDGGMFAFVRANDPDILVMIEATVDSKSSTKSWRYTLGRMNSAPTSVKLDDVEIWSFKGYWTKPDMTSYYVEQREGVIPDEVKLKE